eukprot:10159242-Heterocapsa_arctica.AAC.1
MRSSRSNSSTDLKDVLLKGQHVQGVGEGVEEEVVVSQFAIGQVAVRFVDGEDSQLAVPGRDL